ncbi:hypothetical protein MKQ68_07450 [Chitinophaga horti]|uniref:Uncharacterized protein n=1 Tax=Chitinophaga horti TaxID=2920382 RepID=A0ABY6J8M2_9BACT|nr:hypothetical protein [Chitinophaga horti]UYQ94927.1 hypothetical protein MKQ68_07450 [Chitinophaga horti]
MKDANVANKQLNHGYCLGRYFDMAEHLNDKFKLNHHTFRGGFSTWETIAGKELPHAQFRLIVNERIKFIKDSVSMANERHIALTNYLKENLKIIDYTSLKEAIAKLPAAYAGSSKYYSIVLNEVAKQQPAYYFGLANDFPEQRGMIFWAVDRKKETMDGLRAVPGHEELKKQFFSKK